MGIARVRAVAAALRNGIDSVSLAELSFGGCPRGARPAHHESAARAQRTVAGDRSQYAGRKGQLLRAIETEYQKANVIPVT